MTKAPSSKTLRPKLRFPQFATDEPWRARPLGALCEQILEKVSGARLTPVSITAGRGFVSQAEKFGRDISGEQYKNYVRLRRGEFAYNKGNSNRYPQGSVYQLKEFDEAAASNAFVCFRLKSGNAPTFFEGLFEKNTHGLQLLKFLTSGARSDGLLNIKADEFFSISLPVPHDPAEQRKIGACLTSLDELLTAEGQKLEALRTHKKGLMQQLFSRPGESRPCLRFPEFRDAPEWAAKVGGDLFTNRRENGEEGLPLYSVTMNEGMVPRASFDRNFYDIEEPEGNKKAHKGDIAYNMMRMWQGAQGVAVEDCLVSPAYIVLAPLEDVCSEFFAYLFKLPQSLQLLTSHSRGLTKDRLRLYFDDFKRVPLRVPRFAEQQRIAACLSSLDALIVAQSRKLAGLQDHKRGLLQQLFPQPEEE